MVHQPSPISLTGVAKKKDVPWHITGLFPVFDFQKQKTRTAGLVFSGLGPVQLWSFPSLETGPSNTICLCMCTLLVDSP